MEPHGAVMFLLVQTMRLRRSRDMALSKEHFWQLKEFLDVIPGGALVMIRFLKLGGVAARNRGVQAAGI